MTHRLDIETLGLNVDPLRCDAGQGGRDRDTRGKGGDGGGRQIHKARRVGEYGSTAHHLQKVTDACLSSTLYRLNGAMFAQRPSWQTTARKKQTGSVAAQVLAMTLIIAGAAEAEREECGK